MPEGGCELCWAMADDDCQGQSWRMAFHYRKVFGVHHGLVRQEGVPGPHMDDPYRL